MKKGFTKVIAIFIAGFAIFFTGQTFANYLPVEALSTVYTCGEQADLYLDEDNDNDNLYDYWLYLRSNFRLTSENPPTYNAGQILQYNDASNTDNTKVFYYSAESEMLRKRDVTTSGFYVLDNTTFKRASRVFPYNQWVRGIDTNNTRVLFEQPANLSADHTVSVLYSYKYKFAQGYLGGTSPYRYNPIAGADDYHGLSASEYVDRTSSKRDWSQIYTLEKCRNYELSRCGDGIIDEYITGDRANIENFESELCDDGELNGTEGYCDVNCGRGGVETDERCGDNVIQTAGVYYNGSPETIENMSFETCDDGDVEGDNGDGLLNDDDPNLAFCSTQCLPPFIEEFAEVFVNP